MRKILLAGGEGLAYKELPVSIDGPFRLAASRVEATSDLENDRTIYQLHLSLNWEPHFAVFLVQPPGDGVTPSGFISP